MIARLAAVAIAAVISGCSVPLKNYDAYRGDGTFTARPAPSALCQDGYTVDLGAVDLTTRGEVAHSIEGLPPIESTIGLAIAGTSGSDATDPPRPAASIELTLRDAAGHIVLARHENLSEWTASFAADDPGHVYFFQRGTTIEVAVARGVSRVERFPIGADDSWGTYFTPRRGARYTLHLAVEEPDADFAGATAHLQVNGVAGCP